MVVTMEERFSLKDHLFNEQKVQYLAERLVSVQVDFSATEFVVNVMRELPRLELKDRIRHIATVLRTVLPSEYTAAVAMMISSLPPPLNPTRTDDDFGDFIFAPYGEFIARYGCEEKYLKVSLQALEAITMRFSMEDAIRTFLRAYPEETLAECRMWATHPHYHVRRLVSEGTRPLLPWSGRVPLSATDTLPLLTLLHSDTARYVTRSVANHLNDIGKTDPLLVVAVLREWKFLGQQTNSELQWMTNHALRMLVKQGHKDALALLGYQPAKIQVTHFSASPRSLNVGSVITLTTKILAEEDTVILIDYVIHFMKKNGTTAPKVFKWKTCQLQNGEIITLTKQHRLKAGATTFTLYPGVHQVDIQINGTILATSEFILL